MAEKFSKSNYVEVVKSLAPELDNAKNPLDLPSLKTIPSLKTVVLLDDTKIHGFLNMKDLYSLYSAEDSIRMFKREKKINFEEPTNI